MSLRERIQARNVAGLRGDAGRFNAVCWLSLTLALAACDDGKSPASIDTDKATIEEKAPETIAVQEVMAPTAPVEPVPPEPPLDLTLPSDEMERVPLLAEDLQEDRLPDLFGSGKRSPSPVSGKLLFEEGGQEGAIDNISGAQLEVKIPVR